MHSPVDDLESCFWVSFWAVSFNKDHIKAKSEIEIGIRDKLATGHRVEALHHLHMCRIEGNYSKSFHYFRPITIIHFVHPSPNPLAQLALVAGGRVSVHQVSNNSSWDVSGLG